MGAAWEEMALDNDEKHYRLAYDRENTWSQKYNLVWDKMWGSQVFPAQVMTREMAYYTTKQNAYGLPLDSREAYSKSDWVLWTAAMVDNTNKRAFQRFSDPIWNWVNETTDRVPLSDWYWTDSKHFRGFPQTGSYPRPGHGLSCSPCKAWTGKKRPRWRNSRWRWPASCGRRRAG